MKQLTFKGFGKSFPQYAFEKSLCDHYITILVAGKIRIIDSN